MKSFVWALAVLAVLAAGTAGAQTYSFGCWRDGVCTPRSNDEIRASGCVFCTVGVPPPALTKDDIVQADARVAALALATPTPQPCPAGQHRCGVRCYPISIPCATPTATVPTPAPTPASTPTPTQTPGPSPTVSPTPSTTAVPTTPPTFGLKLTLTALHLVAPPVFDSTGHWLLESQRVLIALCGPNVPVESCPTVAFVKEAP